MGQVELGKNVGIWFGSVLRGDNDLIKIGDETNIQENTIIHVDPGCPVTIGRNCTIGHNAIIHGCTIGNNTLIGMGATILNNAKIGNNCLVGAGALVTENKEFPDGSLIVGSPAKALAGDPTINDPSGNSLFSVTSAPAPTKQLLPIFALFKIVAPIPIRVLFPIVQP